MNAWIIIGAVGVGSFALRAAMLVFATSRPLPGRVEASLGLVGPAAVAALLATMTLTSGGSVAPLPFAELAAVVAGFAAVRHTGKVVHAFTVGLPVLWVLSVLAG